MSNRNSQSYQREFAHIEPSDNGRWQVQIFFLCFKTLFARPGFLYNRLWAQTILGLNEHGFKKVEDKFVEAKFNGIFSDDSNPRWWKSRLIEILGELTEGNTSPWILGKQLVDENEQLLSKCHVSGENYPETVAAEDETETTNWYPMRLKYTDSYSLYENMLFFEELRIMSPAE